jgi:ribonuclease-3
VNDRRKLSAAIDYAFASDALLSAALTHRSAGGHNNERLEYLGDAVLGLVIADALYAARPQAREGELSRLRASLVKREALAGIAREIGLGEYLVLGAGEHKSGGFRRASILADALEAVVGAIYLDGGFAAARDCVLRLYRARLAALPEGAGLKDPKTRLQELLQGRGYALPQYELTDIRGEAHQQQFTARCDVADLEATAAGTGTSRQNAEQQAAQAMLDLLAEEPRLR